MGDLFEEAKQGPVAPPAGVQVAPQVIQATPPMAPTKPKFDFTPTKTGSKRVIMIYGDKNSGKTNVMEAFAGNSQDTMSIISMDNQSASIWENFYESTDRIQIYDGVKYFIEDPALRIKIPESGWNNFQYIVALLNDVIAKNPPDWIAIDGLSILALVAEQVMRYENSIGATQGFPNLNLWKERGYHLRTIHRLAYGLAKKGVIYTTYGEFQIEEVEGGQTVKGKTKPKWFDVIMQETEVIIHTFFSEDKAGNTKYYYKIESTKMPKFLPKTPPMEVTDKKIMLPFGGLPKQNAPQAAF